MWVICYHLHQKEKCVHTLDACICIYSFWIDIQETNTKIASGWGAGGGLRRQGAEMRTNFSLYSLL